MLPASYHSPRNAPRNNGRPQKAKPYADPKGFPNEPEVRTLEVSNTLACP
jgi:hypothetical protein